MHDAWLHRLRNFADERHNYRVAELLVGARVRHRNAERVIEASDLSSIYEAPLVYHANGLDTEVCKYFKMEAIF